jgi:hypothetical protein
MTNLWTVTKLIRKLGRYNISRADIEETGGVWNANYAVYVFPDGSCGSFTDLSGGAEERTSTGEPRLHFIAMNELLPL